MMLWNKDVLFTALLSSPYLYSFSNIYHYFMIIRDRNFTLTHLILSWHKWIIGWGWEIFLPQPLGWGRYKFWSSHLDRPKHIPKIPLYLGHFKNTLGIFFSHFNWIYSRKYTLFQVYVSPSSQLVGPTADGSNQLVRGRKHTPKTGYTSSIYSILIHSSTTTAAPTLSLFLSLVWRSPCRWSRCLGCK